MSSQRRKLTFGAGGVAAPPIETLVRAGQRCEEQGYDAMWWPDHLMGIAPASLWTPDFTNIARFQPDPHVYMDPFVAMAATALSTSRLKVGTMVTETVRRHPAVLAQTLLSIDHVSKGRCICGIGSGEGMNTEPYGLDFRRPVARLEEALKVIRMLWKADGPVDFEGQFWKLKDAVLALAPYHPGMYPPIWLAAHGPRTQRIAGQYGDGWLPSRVMSAPEYGERLAAIRQTAREHGRDPQAITPGLAACLVIDRDHEACHRLFESSYVRFHCLQNLPAPVFELWGSCPHPFGERYAGLADFIPTRWTRSELEAAIEKVPREVAETFIFHGTPEEVGQEIRQYVEQGLEHVVMINLTAAIPVANARSSGALTQEVVRYLSESTA